MIIESELRAEMVRAVSGNVPLNDLSRWVTARNWNAHKDSTLEAQALAADVEMLFIERSNGDVDDDDVRLALGNLLNQV
jgi:hypothetical protein